MRDLREKVRVRRKTVPKVRMVTQHTRSLDSGTRSVSVRGAAETTALINSDSGTVQNNTFLPSDVPLR
jgi:hypothetical protein